MNSAPARAHANNIHFGGNGASAVPMRTGTTDAESVFGRVARSQDFMQVGGLPVARLPGCRWLITSHRSPVARQPGNPRSSQSRKPRKLLVVRLPLLHVRIPPLLRLFGQVVEERCVTPEIEEADLTVAVGVHRRLQEATRHRRELEHLA